MKRWAWSLISIGVVISFLFFFFMRDQLNSLTFKLQDPMYSMTGDSGQIKLPPYTCELGNSYSFKLKQSSSFLSLFPSSVFDFTGSELSFDEDLEYYAYPLSRLDIDLNVEEIGVEDGVIGHQDFVIAGDGDQEPCRFSSYQAKDRNVDQILDFLLALTEKNFAHAAELLKKDQRLIPFIGVLDRCDFVDWKGGDGKLVGSGICETTGGLEILNYLIWIERGSLYLRVEGNEDPDVELRLLLQEKIDAFESLQK